MVVSNNLDETVKNKGNYERSDFALRVQYKNTLPDLTYGTKCIPYAFDKTKSTSYKPSSLEKQYNYEMNFEDNTGDDINLVNIDFYKTRLNDYTFDQTDLLLLNDDSLIDSSNKRNRKIKQVSWLRRSDLMNVGKQIHKTAGIIERTITANSTLNSFKNKYKSRDEQIVAIEKTFQDVKKPITAHHSNSELKQINSYAVLPDYQLWKHTFSHINFDVQPTFQGKSDHIERKKLDGALLKGMSDSQGEFVGYFIRNDRLNYSNPDKMHTYELAREYNWLIQNTASSATEDLYSWRIEKDGVILYNEITTRIKLSKRRLEGGRLKNKFCSTMLVVRDRENNTDEIFHQEKRVEALMKKKHQYKVSSIDAPVESKPEDNLDSPISSEEEGQ